MTAAVIEQEATRWSVVAAAVGGGVAAAMQVGKASAVMPLLRAEFGVSITAVSSYLAMASLGAALLGLTIGMAAQRFGALRAGVTGLAVLSVASIVGAATSNWTMLFAMRLVEAAGMPLVVASMPALIQSACSPARRVLALGIWAAWLPLGIALAMFLSVPLAEDFGWRTLYLCAGAMPLAAIAALLLSRPALPVPAAPPSAAPQPWRLPQALLNVGMAFSCFSAIYLTFTGFLPTVAEADLGLSLENAAMLTGSMALLIVIGNLLAAALLVRGFPASTLLALALAVMGLCAALFLVDFLPAWQRILAAIVFNLAGGVAPGVIWAYVPVLSHRLGLGASLVSGVLYQSAGTGQLLGPILAGMMVDLTGSWLACLAVIVPCAALAIWLNLRGPEGRRRRQA